MDGRAGNDAASYIACLPVSAKEKASGDGAANDKTGFYFENLRSCGCTVGPDLCAFSCGIVMGLCADNSISHGLLASGKRNWIVLCK